MDLLDLIIVFVVVGVVLYLINTYVPMEARVKQLLNIVVIILLVLLVLRATGLLDSLRGVRVGQLMDQPDVMQLASHNPEVTHLAA